MTNVNGVRTERGRKLGGEEGAVIVEFALMAPLLVLLVLGIVEYGSVLRNDTTITGAIRNSARVGAQVRDDALSDKAALSSLHASIGSAQRVVINKVVIYRANASSGEPSTNCVNTNVTTSPTAPHGTPSDYCNAYSAAQVAAASTGGTWATATSTCGSGSGWDRAWCPAVRKAALTGADSPPDYLGVYISVTYTPITGLFAGTKVYTDYAVNRIEPKI